jgi:hypothetical protein
LIGFFVEGILTSLIIIMFIVVNQQMLLFTPLVMVSVTTGLLPAFIDSSTFSIMPGRKDLLRTYINPISLFGYYLLVLVLFPTLWLLENHLSNTMGIKVGFSSYSMVNVKLLGMVILYFLYHVIYDRLSEEPDWRGFALPRF